MFPLARFSGSELEAAAGWQDLVGNRQRGEEGAEQMSERNPAQLAASFSSRHILVMKQNMFASFFSIIQQMDFFFFPLLELPLHFFF